VVHFEFQKYVRRSSAFSLLITFIATPFICYCEMKTSLSTRKMSLPAWLVFPIICTLSDHATVSAFVPQHHTATTPVSTSSQSRPPQPVNHPNDVLPATTEIVSYNTYQEELQKLLRRRFQPNPTMSSGPISEMSTTVTKPSSAAANSNKKKMERRPNNDSVLQPSSLQQIKKKPAFPSKSAELLSAAQEIEYSYRIRTLRAAMRIREQLVTLQNAMYIHPTEQQWSMACGTTLKQLRRIIAEGQDAKAKLVASNTGLVVQYAKKHYSTLKYAMEAGGGVGTILTVSDMIQEGNLGLMEAAERFVPEKGFRFSTYATYWVRQRILRSISDSSRIIRLPVHVHEMLHKIKKAKRSIFTATGREPSLSDLARHLEMSEERIRLYTASSRNVLSLERPLGSSKGGGNTGGGSRLVGSSAAASSRGGSSNHGSGGSTGSRSSPEDSRTLLDMIASDGPTPEEDAVLDSMRRDIRSVLDTELSGLEQQVLMSRFGLNEHESFSVKETASALNISMDRVRHLEARALNKLRHPMRNYKLKDYVQGATFNAAAPPEPLLSYSQSVLAKSRLEETFANSPSTTSVDINNSRRSVDRLWFF
jgi:RNA polymerase sigma factor (sigma-70 family)